MRRNLKRMALLLLIAVVLIPMAVMTALASGNENLAQGKTATASSSYPGKPWTPDKAVDGDTSGSDSRWSSKRATGTTNEGDGDVGTKEQWLQIDLGTVTAVEQVNIYWEAAFATSYEIQTSLDGEEFQTVKECTATEAGAQSYRDLGVEEAQYIRINCLEPKTAKYGYSIYEVEVFAENKMESAQDVLTVERAVEAAEEEFGVEKGRTLLMAALESPKGILNAYEICAASDRMFGVAISGGDFRKCMQTVPQPDGVDMLAARGQMLLAARAAGIQCFDTVFTNLDDEEGFRAEVLQNKAMGFDGKSLINPKQIRFVHQVFAPTEKEVRQAEKIIRAYREQSAAGVGVFTVDGKMIDIAFIPGAERTLKLARACGMYEGDLV